MELRNPKARVTSFAAKLGAEITTRPNGPGDRGIDIRIDAPQGFVWKCGEVHCIVATCFTHPSIAWEDLLERMQDGIEPCEEPDCDICGETSPERGTDGTSDFT